MKKSTKERITKWLIDHHLLSFATMARARYLVKFHKLPHIKKPRDLNEHILNQLLYTDTKHWENLTDKYAVREYVASRGLEDILPKCYGLWNNAADIDFDALPQQFVLKPTSGSGNVMVVKDKSTLDINKARRTIDEWLKSPYGYYTAEPHYTHIRQRVIAEELLPTDPDQSSLVDYKFWVIGGEIVTCLVCMNRTIVTHGCDLVYYDVPSWKLRRDMMYPSYLNDSSIERPEKLEEMMEYALRLAEGFSQVRVDFYQVGGKVVFGEMTMSSDGGRMRDLNDSALLEIGQKITEFQARANS